MVTFVCICMQGLSGCADGWAKAFLGSSVDGGEDAKIHGCPERHWSMIMWSHLQLRWNWLVVLFCFFMLCFVCFLNKSNEILFPKHLFSIFLQTSKLKLPLMTSNFIYKNMIGTGTGWGRSLRRGFTQCLPVCLWWPLGSAPPTVTIRWSDLWWHWWTLPVSKTMTDEWRRFLSKTYSLTQAAWTQHIGGSLTQWRWVWVYVPIYLWAVLGGCLHSDDNLVFQGVGDFVASKQNLGIFQQLTETQARSQSLSVNCWFKNTRNTVWKQSTYCKFALWLCVVQRLFWWIQYRFFLLF